MTIQNSHQILQKLFRKFISKVKQIKILPFDNLLLDFTLKKMKQSLISN
jgi:hypothetical protein